MSVVELLKKYEHEIRERFHLEMIGIFGSFARGEEMPDSDVDVLIEFEEGSETFDNYMDLKYYLEELFHRPVDLVTIDALRPQFKDDILKQVSYA
jgi:hypothetical protein